MEKLKTALEAFNKDTGRYPTAKEGLLALIFPPAGGAGWHGPYVEVSSLSTALSVYSYSAPAKDGKLFGLEYSPLPGRLNGKLVRAAQLVQELNPSFTSTYAAIRRGDVEPARNALSAAMPLMQGLRRTLEGTSASGPVNAVLGQLVALQEALDSGDLDTIRSTCPNIDMMGQQLEYMVLQVGKGAEGSANDAR